jgi:hypothetical protein
MKKLLIAVAAAAFIPITLSHAPLADATGGNARGGIGTHSGWKTGAHDCVATGHCDPPYTGNNGQGAQGGCYYAGSPGHPEYYIGPDPCTGSPYHN